MSNTLIKLNADLKALTDEGFEVSVEGGYLLIHNVPYVDSAKQVRRGILISKLDLAGDKTVTPSTHIALFAGDHPCNADGEKLRHMEHSGNTERISDSITAKHSFSSKPTEGYPDYYAKMTTYEDMISRHARQIDPAATARTGNVIMSSNPDSVFKYEDTASSRVGINTMSHKLRGLRIDIIGLGGTGAYILDHVCKTHVHDIHIYDDDDLLQHNAFRTPGAIPPRILGRKMKKVDYYGRYYGRMRNFIFPHTHRIDASNVDLLQGTDFVFICIDNGPAKKPIVEWLEAHDIPFIDVGMGIDVVNDALAGLLRVTLSTPSKRDHVRAKNRIPFTGGHGNDVYATNIQISDLNSLNANLAVITWKKLFGFYADSDHEHNLIFMIDGSELIGEDEDDES
ncbi:ThiF family adenylyltransferase [Thalassospiraceae bacterium LMO-JJ14]|nr:ThiF family adenylyltransferase [Thalassospiraceae bacterium LMO-JJ14]